HHICSLPDLLLRNSCNRIRKPLVFERNTQGIEEFIIPALFELQVDIGEFCGISNPWVDNNQFPAHLSLSGKKTAGKNRIPRHVSWVGMCRVASPENDTICTVFHFTEGA